MNQIVCNRIAVVNYNDDDLMNLINLIFDDTWA